MSSRKKREREEKKGGDEGNLNCGSHFLCYYVNVGVPGRGRKRERGRKRKLRVLHPLPFFAAIAKREERGGGGRKRTSSRLPSPYQESAPGHIARAPIKGRGKEEGGGEEKKGKVTHCLSAQRVELAQAPSLGRGEERGGEGGKERREKKKGRKSRPSSDVHH